MGIAVEKRRGSVQKRSDEGPRGGRWLRVGSSREEISSMRVGEAGGGRQEEADRRGLRGRGR